MTKSHKYEDTPDDSDFEEIVAPIEGGIMRTIVDGAIEDANVLEQVSSELRGVDRVVYEIAVLGEGDTDVRLGGSAHEGHVHVQLVPQPIEDVYGSSDGSAIRANPARAMNIASIDRATLSRSNENTPAIRARIADLYARAMAVDTVDVEAGGVAVVEDHGKDLRVYLDEEPDSEGGRSYISVKRFNFEKYHSELPEDRANDTFNIRIEPEASLNHRNFKAGKRPYDIKVNKQGSDYYSVAMSGAQLHVEAGEPGDVVSWTSKVVLGFLEHEVADRIEDYLKALEEEAA